MTPTVTPAEVDVKTPAEAAGRDRRMYDALSRSADLWQEDKLRWPRFKAITRRQQAA